jgi:hypothetical protein
MWKNRSKPRKATKGSHTPKLPELGEAPSCLHPFPPSAPVPQHARTRFRRSHQWLGVRMARVGASVVLIQVLASGVAVGRGWPLKGSWMAERGKGSHPFPPSAPVPQHARIPFRRSRQWLRVRMARVGAAARSHQWLRVRTPRVGAPTAKQHPLEPPAQAHNPCSSTPNASILCTPRGNFWTFRCVNYWERCIA